MLCYKEQGTGSFTYSEFSLLTTFELFDKLYFFCFPQTPSDGKKSLPKYQQQLILWLKTKPKQTNRNQSNTVILVLQIGKWNVSVIQWFAWAESVPTVPFPSRQLFADTFPSAGVWHSGPARCCRVWHGWALITAATAAIWWSPVINTADCSAQLVHSPLKGKRPKCVSVVHSEIVRKRDRKEVRARQQFN